MRNLYLNFSTGVSEKVRHKYATFLCFFYMNIVVSYKEYWKMIRNIRFYNFCLKVGCGNRVDKNTIYSCCNFLVTHASLFMIDIMLWPNIILRKFYTFLFCLKSNRFISKLLAIITSFLKCHLLLVFYLSVFHILFRHHLVA